MPLSLVLKLSCCDEFCHFLYILNSWTWQIWTLCFSSNLKAILAINSAHCLFSLFLVPYGTYSDHLILAHICLARSFDHPLYPSISFFLLDYVSMESSSFERLACFVFQIIYSIFNVESLKVSSGSISYPFCLFLCSSFNIYLLKHCCKYFKTPPYVEWRNVHHCAQL